MRYNFCPNCGFKLEDIFRFCPMCGTSVVGDGYVSRAPEERYPAYTSREYEYKRPVQTSLDKGKELFNAQDYASALPYLLENKDSNNYDIFYMIGYCYYKTNKSDPNCEKYLKSAAELGHTSAQATLGEYYYNLAEETKEVYKKGYDPNSGMSLESYQNLNSVIERYYNMALVYLSLAKNGGVK